MNDNPTILECQCGEKFFVSVNFTRISHEQYIKIYDMENTKREIARCDVCDEPLHGQWAAQHDPLP